MTINKVNLFVFEVGPSAKFVSAIIDAIFKKKMGVNFLFGKMPNQGGGSEGGLAKDQTFSGFSFVHPSLTSLLSILAHVRPSDKAHPLHSLSQMIIIK